MVQTHSLVSGVSSPYGIAVDGQLPGEQAARDRRAGLAEQWEPGDLAYVRPTHGSALLKSGQAPTGWQVKAGKPTTTVTAYASCAP